MYSSKKQKPNALTFSNRLTFSLLAMASSSSIPMALLDNCNKKKETVRNNKTKSAKQYFESFLLSQFSYIFNMKLQWVYWVVIKFGIES